MRVRTTSYRESKMSEHEAPRIRVAVIGRAVEGRQSDDPNRFGGSVRPGELEYRGAGARGVQFHDVAGDDDFAPDG